jgi:hypothetical protein
MKTRVFIKWTDCNIKVGALRCMLACKGLGGVKEGFGSIRNRFELVFRIKVQFLLIPV